MARLTREDWVDAAYRRFSDDGIAAVAVEPVARSLGATKGSFYWHFDDRRALVDAVLDRWRQLETEQLIDEVDGIADPGARLAKLFEIIGHRSTQRSGERTLYADSAAVEVREPVSAVTERRVQYLGDLLRECGVPRAEAGRRAVLLVSAIVGFQQLLASGWLPAEHPRSLVDTLYGVAMIPEGVTRPDRA
ncbi:TetR/AcrR family transcriptional regulator [Microbacterium sp.]|uniref:TetR/AcrR family transcriptional regulator n=1 Tax=Microbacterium sp. TaxID=51671 RepID=UPI003F702AAE